MLNRLFGRKRAGAQAKAQRETAPSAGAWQGARLDAVLRMAAMGMLREEGGGFVLEAGGERARLSEAKTLFEAYLALDARCGGDWRALDAAMEAPWARLAVDMALSPGAHVDTWRALRMRLVGESLSVIGARVGERDAAHDPRCFALIGLNLCDRVLALLETDAGC